MTKTSPALEDMPSWPKVTAAQEAIAKHRTSGDKAALAAAQKALGDAYTACRAERDRASEASKPPEPPEPTSLDDEPTKVEKPPTPKTTKKKGGGKKTTTSKKKSKTNTK